MLFYRLYFILVAPLVDCSKDQTQYVRNAPFWNILCLIYQISELYILRLAFGKRRSLFRKRTKKVFIWKTNVLNSITKFLFLLDTKTPSKYFHSLSPARHFCHFLPIYQQNWFEIIWNWIMFVHSPLVSSQLGLLTSFFVLRIYIGKCLCDDEEENAVGTLSRHRNERQDKVYSKWMFFYYWFSLIDCPAMILVVAFSKDFCWFYN